MAARGETRNRWTFAVGTLGRDMVYTLVSMYLIFYLTDVMDLSDAVLWWVTSLVLGARLFDAVMDIVMGAIVDNTRTRWGQYKPWIAVGGVASGLLTVALFTDFGLRDAAFVAAFAAIYLLWGLSWTANDIPYWSMLPALSVSQAERERTGALAKIFATLGLFTAVVGILPVTSALRGAEGEQRAWFWFAVGVALAALLTQSVTLVGVREPRLIPPQERTRLRELASVVLRNDQLLWTAIAMVLFMTGYVTTTSFGLYYFKYAYGDEAMYTPFAAILIGSQLVGYLVFPLLRRTLSRKALYRLGTTLIVAGYVAFFFAPANMLWIGAAGVLLFVGQSFVTLLMLLFISDTVEYGQWKLGRRNGAVTFALQPFINKVGAALGQQIVGVTVILSGINTAATPADVTAGGLWLMKFAMLLLPLLLIVTGYLIYRAKYRLDEDRFAEIVADLEARGALRESDSAPDAPK